jgi:hypothetical protein
MPMLAVMTAAEIAAAEAAAVAAAEAAAVQAAQVAAAEAAAVQAAANQTAQLSLSQAAAELSPLSPMNLLDAQEVSRGIVTGVQAPPPPPIASQPFIPEASSQGIMSAAPQAPPTYNFNDPNSAVPQLTREVEAANAASSTPMTTAGASPYALGAPSTAPVSSQGIMSAAPQAPTSVASPATAYQPDPATYSFNDPNSTVSQITREVEAADAARASQPLQLPANSTLSAGEKAAGYTVEGTTPSSFSEFTKFAKDNPYLTGAAAYTTAYNLGLLDPRGMEMPDKKSYGSQPTLSKDFRASEATPDIYKPTYQTYAEGGVMSVGGPSSDISEPRKVNNPMATVSSMVNGGIPNYAKGGTLSDSLDYYKQMIEGQGNKTDPGKGDAGIFRDSDPDTMYLDPASAAQVRMAKLNKRANMQMPGMKRPTPMGKINIQPPGAKRDDSPDVESAAQGGIMQARSSLGGYAAGGNPRLLRGPGDGMSDNIPAVIGRKQPARLADGEFVIPADVVSHLGNGSTEAGAKRLHEMMTKVRRERTGNPKQGKQINPRKYLPA